MSAMTRTFAEENEATNWAIDWLRQHGWIVTQPLRAARGMTVGAFRRRYAPGLSSGALTQRLRHPQCPDFAADRGPSGRILRIEANPELIAWVGRQGTPGKAVAR